MSSSVVKLGDMESIINWYYVYWTTKGTLPTVKEIADHVGVEVSLIQFYTNTEEFRRKLQRRGVPLTAEYVLTSEQYKAIMLIADPTRKGRLKERLKEAGVSYNTYLAWQSNPLFKRTLEQFIEKTFEAAYADVSNALVSKAASGDFNSIKFYYEMTGRYDPAAKETLNVMAVLSQVVEIIQRNVSDPVALDRIARDMSMLKGLGGPAGVNNKKVIESS